MKKKDVIELLDGTEVRSIQFEDLVYVDGKNERVIDCYTGKVHKPTVAQWIELFHEAFRQEFGHDSVDALLKEEFGGK